MCISSATVTPSGRRLDIRGLRPCSINVPMCVCLVQAEGAKKRFKPTRQIMLV